MKRIFQLTLVATFCVALSFQQGCSIQNNKDIGLDNMGERNGQSLENCCNVCRDTPGCKAYAWNDYRGGTCWLKAGTGPIIQKDGVSVGTLNGNGGGSEADCWWSGCQPSNWAQRGCFPPDKLRQTKSESCPGGDKYFCCPVGGGGGQNPSPNPGQGALVSYSQFSNAVTSNGYPTPSQEIYNAFIQGLPKGSISSKEEAAMALAQFLHESAGLTAKREFRCASNGCPGEYATASCDAPGQRYYGRGYIQLTWCDNYRAASRDLFGNDSLVSNPDSVATNENLAWDTSFWFWKINVHGQSGVSDGRFGVTTKAINGDRECRGDNSVARTRFTIYGKVRAAFGLNGSGDERGNPVERGMCSFYGVDGELPPNALTASGAVFDRNAMTAAHKTIGFGRSVRVKSEKTDQTVDVIINDRGPFVDGRILDLSFAAFGRIGNRDDGVIPCSYVFI